MGSRSRRLGLSLDVGSMEMQPEPLPEPNLITYSFLSSSPPPPQHSSLLGWILLPFCDLIFRAAIRERCHQDVNTKYVSREIESPLEMLPCLHAAIPHSSFYTDLVAFVVFVSPHHLLVSCSCKTCTSGCMEQNPLLWKLRLLGRLRSLLCMEPEVAFPCLQVSHWTISWVISSHHTSSCYF
jgi:hypothetical protein